MLQHSIAEPWHLLDFSVGTGAWCAHRGTVWGYYIAFTPQLDPHGKVLRSNIGT